MHRRAFLLALVAVPIALTRLGRFNLDMLDFTPGVIPSAIPSVIGIEPPDYPWPTPAFTAAPSPTFTLPPEPTDSPVIPPDPTPGPLPVYRQYFPQVAR